MHRHTRSHIMVIEKVLLDRFGLVSERNDEFLETIGRINGHDVPKYRSSADLDHRFWPNGRLFSQPCPLSAGKNHRFHQVVPSWLVRSGADCIERPHGLAARYSAEHIQGPAACIVPAKLAPLLSCSLAQLL